MLRRTRCLVLIAALVASAGLGCPDPGPAASGEGAASRPAVPDRLGVVPDFALTDQKGAALGKGDLSGKVWVASFVFTRCAGPCPRIMAVCGELQDSLFELPGASPETLRLVSFSVDPDHDSTAVLAAWGEKLGVDAGRWHLLTGERAAIDATVRDGFHLAIARAEDPSVDASMAVTHSTRLCIVDGEGVIRGYYDVDDPATLAAVRRKVKALLGARS